MIFYRTYRAFYCLYLYMKMKIEKPYNNRIILTKVRNYIFWELVKNNFKNIFHNDRARSKDLPTN